MIKSKKVKIEIEETEDIICNKCEKSTLSEMSFEYAQVTAMWGYGTKKDGEEHEFHLCERCYDQLVKSLSIKPDISTSFFKNGEEDKEMED